MALRLCSASKMAASSVRAVRLGAPCTRIAPARPLFPASFKTRAAAGTEPQQPAGGAGNENKESKAVVRGRMPPPALYGGSSLFPGRVGQLFRQMEDEMNQMVRAFNMDTFAPPSFERLGESVRMPAMAVDVKEEQGEYIVTADVPGLPKEAIKINVSPDRMLTISGERKHEVEENEDAFHRVERAYGTFLRTFQLPNHVDTGSIKARCEHGVLTLHVPKSDKEEAQGIQVAIE